MLLTDLKGEGCINNLTGLLREYFNYDIPIGSLSLPQVNKLLESTNKKISEFKNSELYHTSENNSSYMGLLTTKKLLEAWLNEANIPQEDIIILNGKKYYLADVGGADKWYRIVKNGTKLGTKSVTNGDLITALNNAREEKESPVQTKQVTTPEDEEQSINTQEPNNREEKTSNITPVASHVANFLGATVGAFKAGLHGQGIHKDWGKMLPSQKPKNVQQLKKIIDNDFLNQDPFSKLSKEQKLAVETFLGKTYTPNKNMSREDVLNSIKKDKTLNGISKEVKAQIGSVSLILNKFAQKTNESVNMKKKRVIENAIKSRARKMLNEGEVASAESLLASKDLVDRLQDTIEELGKMSNDELPHLIDAIRDSFGQEQATAYQQTANSVLSSLLDTVKEKKSELENATLVLSGDVAADTSSDLALPDDDGEEIPDMDGDELGASDYGQEKPRNPLGRETRIPAEESLIRKFKNELREWEESGFKKADSDGWMVCKSCNNKGCKKCNNDGGKWDKTKKVNESKAMLNAKIVAISEALKKTDKKKKPIVAKRLAEALRTLVTEAVKKESKKKVDDKKKKKVVKEERIAAKVAGDKKKNPEKFCKNKTCLYKTNAEFCPKHKPTEKK